MNRLQARRLSKCRQRWEEKREAHERDAMLRSLGGIIESMKQSQSIHRQLFGVVTGDEVRH